MELSIAFQILMRDSHVRVGAHLLIGVRDHLHAKCSYGVSRRSAKHTAGTTVFLSLPVVCQAMCLSCSPQTERSVTGVEPLVAK